MALPTAAQRRFAVIATDTFKIVDRIATNQRVCRLLKYQVKNPFSDELEDVNGDDLIHKQICVVPKIPDEPNEKMSYVNIVFTNFMMNPVNADAKIVTLRFDIICPYDEWVIDGSTLRPYAIMQEIDDMFNGNKLAGIGNLRFVRADAIALTNRLGGYSIQYKVDEFN